MPKMYRFTIYPFGIKQVLAWRDWNPEDFLQTCEAWGINGCAFDVEFKLA